MFDYESRQAAVQERMADRDLDLAVFGAGPNLQYLTGATVDWRRCPDLEPSRTALFVPREGRPVLLAGGFTVVDDDLPCDVRRLDHFEDARPTVEDIVDATTDTTTGANDVGIDRVGIEEYADASVVVSVENRCRGAELVSVDGMLDDVRAVKTSAEVDRLRAVAELTDEVMAEVVDGLAEGQTMREIELRIEHLGRRRGASHVSFPPSAILNRAGGDATDDLSNYGSDQGLEPGTAVAFDVGFVRNGYCSDWGRSFYVGDPPEGVAEAYAALQSAVVETIDAVGEEVSRANEVYPHIEAVCDREGYGDLMRNRHADGKVMGHGIGVEVHEGPWLRPDVDAELRDGMVFAIEPKLWKPGEFYLRVEDLVHVTGTGAESLTQFDRGRFVL